MTHTETGTGIPEVGRLLRVGPGSVELDQVDPEGKPGFDGDKAAGKAALAALDGEMGELQTKLAAHAYTGGHRSLLLVLQGMDTSGKGGVLKHVVGLMNPGGVHAKAFSTPTEEEQAHDFLWRIEKEKPGPGKIGIFDRSHYEDVLVAKVQGLAPEEEIERRYGAINDFERRLVDEGCTVVKCMLHISKEEQRQRLLARLENPRKVWKFKPGDIEDRERWDDYQRAYEVALERCGTGWAPWHVVPSNRKWYRSLAIASLVRDALADMRLEWPEPDFDVEEQKRRLGA
jgi:PPK2 family polyphosphate:nucleotide phosphotransferase